MQRIKKFFLILILLFFYSAAGSSSEPVDIEAYQKAIKTISKDVINYGNNELKKFYLENCKVPSKVFNLRFKLKNEMEFLIQTSEVFDTVQFDNFNTPEYNALGYVGNTKDMWFSGIQTTTVTGSIYYNDGQFIKYQGVFDNNPAFGKVFFHNGKWRPGWIDGTNVYATIDREKILLFNTEKLKIDEYNFSRTGRIYNGKTWWESYLRIEFRGGLHARDLALLCYDVFTKEKEIYILPGTSRYTTFGKSMMPANTTDTKGRIYLGYYYFSSEKFSEVHEGSVLILDAEEDTLYQIRHEIPHWREALAAHYVLGEDGNIYFQVVTEKVYYIYRIEPLWDKELSEAEYEPLFLEVYPELKEVIGRN
jgi:hypothetical protein